MSAKEDRLAVLRKLLHDTILDLIITCKFSPKEISRAMVCEMGWLRTFNG
jgi:hypothetical protein